MGRDRLSASAFMRVAKEVKSAGGPATAAGEQRHKAGKGLHPLVDPKGHGVIRRSLSWLEPKGDHFELLRGTAMLVEDRFDTTGSMGDNVDKAFDALPRSYDRMMNGSQPVLGRYDLQMITSIFGDVCDNYVLCRSQAELDERIAEQMRLMVPEHGGGDNPEDPQYGLFGAAYLTDCTAVQLGLKTYDFTTTDAPGRNALDPDTLIRVFGDKVADMVKENGYQVDFKHLPSTREVVQSLLSRSHAFLLQVGEAHDTSSFWRPIFGKERIVVLPRVELLPEVRTAIIGLTEGVVDLQGLVEFLMEHAKLKKADAEKIQSAVAKIPLGAQAALPNFKKIPLKGALFAKKGDLWPIGYDGDGNKVGSVDTEEKPAVPAKPVGTSKKKKEEIWK